MTRHLNDSGLIGKLVYILACMFNSFAIFMTQTTFYIIGLPYFTGILILMMRFISNFDEYDAIIVPTDGMTVFLYFVVVMMPLKFIPIMFGKLVESLTNRWILHKSYHLKVRNRIGYDMPDIAQFMFLPSSNNNYNHVVDDESTANPGFSYFSKDPTSKHLYRLKFETHIFRKVTMHLIYMISTFFFLNTIHLVLEINPGWLGLFKSYSFFIGMAFSVGIFPTLVLSFGLLYCYYTYFHPWVSEGVSVGFEPLDNEIWKPDYNHLPYFSEYKSLPSIRRSRL